MSRVLICGGGTGGHIYPGLALANYLHQHEHDVAWMGRHDGMEKTLVGRESWRYFAIGASPIRAKGLGAQLRAIFTLVGGVYQAVRILRQFRPLKVVTMGGYVSVPGALAAWICRIPIVCFEQNARIGLANRLIARLATRHVSGFPCNDSRFVALGNPLRPDILQKQIPSERCVHVLLMGGSQGANVISQDVLGALKSQDGLIFKVLVGFGHSDDFSEHAAENVEIIEYCDDMNDLYQWADLVVARSGAMSVSEIMHVGLAAIFLPLPGSADDHQYYNALYAQQMIGSQVVKDNNVDEVVAHVRQSMQSWKVVTAVSASEVCAKIMDLIFSEAP